MIDIKTEVKYNPKLNFDAWAKLILDIPLQDVGYTQVTCTAELPTYGLRPWKGESVVDVIKEMVKRCATQYGGALEGRHFYYTRKQESTQYETFIEVNLFVVEK